MGKLNNQQWAAAGVICLVFAVNACLIISPATKSILWAINIILIVFGSSLFYVLRNEDMSE